jgi:hypothetical protein
LSIEVVEVITPTDVLLIDKDLGDAATAVGAIGHGGAGGFIAINFVLDEMHTFPPQQQFGPNAIGADLPGVEFDVGLDLVCGGAEEEVEEGHGNKVDGGELRVERGEVEIIGLSE